MYVVIMYVGKEHRQVGNVIMYVGKENRQVGNNVCGDYVCR